MGAMNPFLVQDHYRTRSDTTAADPGTPVWETTEDQSASLDWTTGITFRIRFVISNTGDGGATPNFNLFLSKEGGAYAAITTSSTNGVQAADASSSADNTTLTTGNFQLTAGTGSATNGNYSEDGIIGTNLTNGDFFELEYGLTIIQGDVNEDDTLDFRVYTATSAFDTYATNATPRIIAKFPIIRKGRAIRVL